MGAAVTGRWRVQLVATTPVGSLDGFVDVVFDGDHPVFKFRNGELWKSACSIKVWDDGRVHVRAEKHLTPCAADDRRGSGAGVLAGWARGVPAGEVASATAVSKRPVTSWATSFWVRAEQSELGFAAAHADQQIVVQSDWKAFNSTAEQWWLDDGADERVVAMDP